MLFPRRWGTGLRQFSSVPFIAFHFILPLTAGGSYSYGSVAQSIEAVGNPIDVRVLFEIIFFWFTAFTNSKIVNVFPLHANLISGRASLSQLSY